MGLYDTRLTSYIPLLAPVAPPAFVAERDASVRTAVVDEHDKPIAGALVRFFSLRGDRPYFVGEARAGDDGIATLDGLPRGETWALAYGEGRSRGSMRLVLGPGERTIRLVLQPALSLSVVVVDETEKPFPDVNITVTGADPLPWVAKTGDDGKAQLDRLGQGPFSVRASAQGYDDVVRTGVVPGPVPLRIKLEKLGAFAVSVVEADGDEAPFALVLCAGTGIWPARSVVADEHGVAKIAGLRRGNYDLVARLGDRISATELGLSLERAETQPVKLVLHPGRRITVKVTDGEAEDAPPIKDASVILAEEGLSPFPLLGRTDAKGFVVLGPVAFGPATVSARAKGFVPRSAVFLDNEATEISVALLRGGALVGDVFDDRGFPVGGATIEVVGVDVFGMPIDETSALSEFRDDHFEASFGGPSLLLPMGELGVLLGPIPDLPHAGTLLAEVATPSVGGDPWVSRGDGDFRAEPVPPGRVYAIVRHPDYVEAVSETVTIKSGGEAYVKVILRQGGSLEGRVLDADKRPVSGARVELAASQGSLERIAIADEAGTFAFAAVPDEVLLSVARPEAPSDIVAKLIVQIPDRERKEVEIVLPRKRDAVLVHVADDRGYPLDRVEVRAVSLDPEVPLRRTLFTNDDGDVEVPDAVSLPLRVTLQRPGKGSVVQEIEVAPTKLVYEMAEGIVGRLRITGHEGRERVAGATVVLHTRLGPRRFESDAEGELEITDLAPSRLRIHASHPEWASAEKIVVLAAEPGKQVDLGALDLDPAGEVEGTVLDPNDEPVAGARVGIGSVPTYLPLGPLPPGITTTNRDGKYVLKNVPEGETTIEAYFVDLGRAAVTTKIRAGLTSTRVDITLPGEGVAKGESKGAGSLALTLGERSEGKTKAVVVVMVPPGGEAELAGIEPGERLLRVGDREVRSIEEARRRLSGPLGEDVVLTLAPDTDGDKPRKLRVRRERVRR